MIEVVKIPTTQFTEQSRPLSYYKDFDWKNGNKQDAVLFARATGFKETGMSMNEIALLFDVLEKKKPRELVELGRNYGCSTRLLLQYVLRHGGSVNSWDYKDWPGFIEGMADAGYVFEPWPGYYRAQMWTGRDFAPDAFCAIELAHSIKTPIVDDKKVDFLLIDTEHTTMDAVSEYCRWRHYLQGGALIAFHDSELPSVARALEIIKEMEEAHSPGRIVRQYENESIDGFGITVLEWKA